MNIKLEYDGEIHRVKSQPRNYKELSEAITKTFSNVLPRQFKIKYLDSDKDLINIDNEEDFEMCFRFYLEEKLKILKIMVIETKKKNMELSSDFFFNHQYNRVPSVIDQTPVGESMDLTHNKVILSTNKQLAGSKEDEGNTLSSKVQKNAEDNTLLIPEIDEIDLSQNHPASRKVISENLSDHQVSVNNLVERSKSLPVDGRVESGKAFGKTLPCYFCVGEPKKNCRDCLGKGECVAQAEDIELIKYILDLKSKSMNLSKLISPESPDILTEVATAGTSQLSRSKVTVDSSATTVTPSVYEPSQKRASQLTSKGTFIEEELEAFDFPAPFKKENEKPPNDLARGVAKKATFCASNTKDLSGSSSILNMVARPSDNLSKSVILPSNQKPSGFQQRAKQEGKDASPTNDDQDFSKQKTRVNEWGHQDERAKIAQSTKPTSTSYSSIMESKTGMLPKAKLVQEIKLVVCQVNKPFIITLEFKNPGEEWPKNIWLRCVSGIFDGFKEKLEDFDSLIKDGSKKLRIPLIAYKTGKQKSFWRLSFLKDGTKDWDDKDSENNATFFGPRIELEHNVENVEENAKKGDPAKFEDIEFEKFKELMLTSRSASSRDEIDDNEMKVLYGKFKDSVSKLKKLNYI